MKRRLSATCLIALTLCFGACNSGQNEQQHSVTASQTETSTNAALSDEKKELLAFAARNAQLQIQLNKLASEKSATDKVKSYSRQLTDWYTAQQQEVQQLAQTYNLTLPEQLESQEQKQLEELRQTEADKFDRVYWRSIANLQKEAIRTYDKNLKDVTETDVDAFSTWARTALKELHAQRDKTATLRTALRMEDDM